MPRALKCMPRALSGFRNYFVASAASATILSRASKLRGFRNHFVAGKQIQQPVIFEIWAAPGLAEIARTTSEALRARFSSERSPEFPGAA